MNTYWHIHPRNFANECIMYRAETKEEAEYLESLGFERLTRKEAQRHVAWINGENDAWGSNRAFGHISWDEFLNDPETSASWIMRRNAAYDAMR